MTIGTSDNLQAWTAPVYYIYIDNYFYFFSKKSSRHIRESQKNANASASIHANPQEWQDIKGIQMEGAISETDSKGGQDLAAFKQYVTRFPFVKELANIPFPSWSLDYFSDQLKVRWYKFVPEKIVYLDNSINFGFKIQLQADLSPAKT